LELYITDGTLSSSLLRNFHNVDAGIPPSAVHSLAIMNPPSRDDLPKFQPGHYLRLSNLRAKEYRGELELAWAEMTTVQQHEAGWREKRANVVFKDDELAKTIEA
jgi:hypothetical protein